MVTTDSIMIEKNYTETMKITWLTRNELKKLLVNHIHSEIRKWKWKWKKFIPFNFIKTINLKREMKTRDLIQ